MTSAPQTSAFTLQPPFLGSPADDIQKMGRPVSPPRPGKSTTTVSPSPRTPRLAEGLLEPPSQTFTPGHQSWQEFKSREVLACQTFTAVFEGFRRLHPARPGQTVAVFKVVRSHSYGRSGLYGDQELPEGSEFMMDSVQAGPDILERVKSLTPGTTVHISYQHSHLEVAGERYPVPERLVTQLSISEPDFAAGESGAPWESPGGGQADRANGGAPWQAMPSPVSPDRFGTAVAAYGVQLKSWVDHQVELCLGQQLQGLDVQVMAAREGFVSLEAQLKKAQSEMHSRLDGLMQELADTKASASEQHASNKAMLESESSNWVWQLKEMQRKHTEHETAMSRLQQKHLDLEQSHKDVSDVLWRHQQDHSDGIVKVQRELEIHRDKVLEMETVTTTRLRELGDSHLEKTSSLEASHATQQETFSQTHNRLSKLEEIFAGFTRQHGELESSLSARFDAHLERHSLAGNIESLQKSLEENRFQVKLLAERSAESLDAAMEALQARTRESLEALQVKLQRAFRAELTAAFRSEADTVAMLDHQLWQKERLDLMKLHDLKARERSPGWWHHDRKSCADEALNESRRLLHDRTDSLMLTPNSSPAHNKGRASPGAKLGLYSVESGSADRLASRIDNWP
mmetsp:Transcript_122494/g.225745  ORF Transcript_122494/g.225745 Transcript_122494/m.225745 type:complete len:629 (+) Transcript_122494:51-1937(+)